MTREETAEWVGYYFGLQSAINMKRLPEEYVRFLRGEMSAVEARLPPGTIDAWPRVDGANRKPAMTEEALRKIIYDEIKADIECEADATSPFQEGYAVGFNDCRVRVFSTLLKHLIAVR